MNVHTEMLALRRERLVAECRMQREDLALQLRPLGTALESMNTGMRIAGKLRRHPGWIAAGALGLMLATPRRIGALIRTGTLALRTWRTLAPGVTMLLSRRG